MGWLIVVWSMLQAVLIRLWREMTSGPPGRRGVEPKAGHHPTDRHHRHHLSGSSRYSVPHGIVAGWRTRSGNKCDEPSEERDGEGEEEGRRRATMYASKQAKHAPTQC